MRSGRSASGTRTSRPTEKLPRWFEDIETLPEEPPYGRELFERLGLRGINCGSGRLLERGWLNTDQMKIEQRDGRRSEHGVITRAKGGYHYLQHDSTEPYPIADASFDWAYSEHFVEHLEPDAAIAWLAEVCRLLRPGGLVRVTTPDLRRYVRAYVDAGDPFYAANREALAKLRVYQGQEVPDRRGWMVNGIFYNWGHRWIYDFGELRHTLTEAGFDPASVTQHAFAQGSEPDVAALDGEGRAHESIYVEARRPGS